MACAQMRRWRGDGLEAPRMAVNLSARHLSDLSLPQQVANALLQPVFDVLPFDRPDNAGDNVEREDFLGA